MRSELVLTLIGHDRPGLVEAIAAAVAEHGGNWEESRMAHLAGRFAGILLITVPKQQLPALREALGELEREGLTIALESNEDESIKAHAKQLRLTLVGDDRAGIMRDISRVLAARAINVDELETSCEDAPMAGGRLFRAEALLGVPSDVGIDELRATLEGLADDLMVELNLSPARAGG